MAHKGEGDDADGREEVDLRARGGGCARARACERALGGGAAAAQRPPLPARPPRTSMNLRSRCEPTGRIMSAGCENSRTTTTKVMKMTEMIDSSDVLVSAAMFFSSASGSTAPTAMATSTTRLTHGCARARRGEGGGAQGGGQGDGRRRRRGVYARAARRSGSPAKPARARSHLCDEVHARDAGKDDGHCVADADEVRRHRAVGENAHGDGHGNVARLAELALRRRRVGGCAGVAARAPPRAQHAPPRRRSSPGVCAAPPASSPAPAARSASCSLFARA